MVEVKVQQREFFEHRVPFVVRNQTYPEHPLPDVYSAELANIKGVRKKVRLLFEMFPETCCKSYYQTYLTILKIFYNLDIDAISGRQYFDFLERNGLRHLDRMVIRQWSYVRNENPEKYKAYDDDNVIEAKEAAYHDSH